MVISNGSGHANCKPEALWASARRFLRASKIDILGAQIPLRASMGLRRLELKKKTIFQGDTERVWGRGSNPSVLKKPPPPFWRSLPPLVPLTKQTFLRTLPLFLRALPLFLRTLPLFLRTFLLFLRASMHLPDSHRVPRNFRSAEIQTGA